MTALVDRFGRVHTDLRVSLTDKCNLRCSYCMPAEGLAWLPREEILTTAEVIRLVGVAVGLGITEVRLTGGEPLLRMDLLDVVAGITAAYPSVALSLTTNGIGLDRLAQPLHDAGLRRVNVSLDTLRRDRFASLARRDRLADVLRGLEAAQGAGLNPVKVNTVLLRGVNDDEAVPLLRFCLEHGYELRFIEQMPLDPQHSWDRATMVTADEILVRLTTMWSLEPIEEADHAPARRWLVDGGPATVGVIASVTRPFCADCNRVRLTADGQVRACLFAHDESDLRTALRTGATDAELADRFVAVVNGKRAGHDIDDPSFLQPRRPMSAIGG